MSLFPDPDYIWRETFFVCLPSRYRPTEEALRAVVSELPFPVTVLDVQYDDAGQVREFPVIAEGAGAGFNIVYSPPEDEADDRTIERLLLDTTLFSAGQAGSSRERLIRCDARLDVYHFERATLAAADTDDEVFDPGPVLSVLSQLAKVCHGVAIDPQANAIL